MFGRSRGHLHNWTGDCKSNDFRIYSRLLLVRVADKAMIGTLGKMARSLPILLYSFRNSLQPQIRWASSTAIHARRWQKALDLARIVLDQNHDCGSKTISGEAKIIEYNPFSTFLHIIRSSFTLFAVSAIALIPCSRIEFACISS